MRDGRRSGPWRVHLAGATEEERRALAPLSIVPRA
jgi:hypothetical protein